MRLATWGEGCRNWSGCARVRSSCSSSIGIGATSHDAHDAHDGYSSSTRLDRALLMSVNVACPHAEATPNFGPATLLTGPRIVHTAKMIPVLLPHEPELPTYANRNDQSHIVGALCTPLVARYVPALAIFHFIRNCTGQQRASVDSTSRTNLLRTMLLDFTPR